MNTKRLTTSHEEICGDEYSDRIVDSRDLGRSKKVINQDGDWYNQRLLLTVVVGA